ncbi:STAS domain-containing protein [Nonomuraea cavernae]|uniref:STAS domain-containing protein n=1 Tax=Nonomuraea cavernae TaxID=2045107 RepID=UPI003401CBAA
MMTTDSDDVVHSRSEVPSGDVPAGELLYVDQILRVTCAMMAGPTVVRLVGEVDATNSGALRRALTQALRLDRHLVVDAGRVVFIDVSGVRELASFVQETRVRVHNVPSQMRRLLHMLRLGL